MWTLKEAGEVEFVVNGERKRPHVRAADTLLYTLRQELGLTGAKPGCENGDCGACTVIVDGAPQKSCLMLTAECRGHEVTTVEGLGGAPVQHAFLQEWGFQCGYCTSGFLMVAHALAQDSPNAGEDEMAEWLRSNICRCTGYEEIGAAVRSVLQHRAGHDEHLRVPPKA